MIFVFFRQRISLFRHRKRLFATIKFPTSFSTRQNFTCKLTRQTGNSPAKRVSLGIQSGDKDGQPAINVGHWLRVSAEVVPPTTTELHDAAQPELEISSSDIH
jgi:hypothetical protein